MLLLWYWSLNKLGHSLCQSVCLFYFWLHWVFVAAARGLSLVAVSSGYSVAVHVLLIVVASLVAEHGL